ncbi:hypothetical protein [Roseibium aggregatum]|uniref:hypothetical protein n=1 Tax=Roseibium aggregatum TaxID=187304 RepID=UPI0002E36E18|nr:hypothetical protein [Roseibium aggregatum]
MHDHRNARDNCLGNRRIRRCGRYRLDSDRIDVLRNQILDIGHLFLLIETGVEQDDCRAPDLGEQPSFSRRSAVPAATTGAGR